MKLTKNEKAARRHLKMWVANMGGELFSFPDSDLVVCLIPAINSDRCRFIRAAVSMCSDTDMFTRKRGELIAMERMASGINFAVPGTLGTMAKVAREIEGMMMSCEAIRDGYGYALGTS